MGTFPLADKNLYSSNQIDKEYIILDKETI